MELKTKSYKIAALLFSLALLSSCYRSYGSQLFSYPPGSQPHEQNWQYMGVVRQWEPDSKALSQKGKRKIEIVITDKSDHKILEDSFQLECAFIAPKIRWVNFEELSKAIERWKLEHGTEK